MNDEVRVPLALDVAISLLPPEQPRVHTIRATAGINLGADWERPELIKTMEKFGVELAGPISRTYEHGMLLIDDHGPLFIETDPAALKQLLQDNPAYTQKKEIDNESSKNQESRLA
jgi:hypothetical protein